MARLTVKATARFKVFTPALLRMVNGVYRVATESSAVQEVVITSVNDSTHAPTSKHYTDQALDLRVHNFPGETAIIWFKRCLEIELGPAFTVLYEGAGTANAHLHLQVKRGTTYTGQAA